MTQEKKDLTTRWSRLKEERTSWVPHWEELSKFILPRHGRFFLGQNNRGEKKHNNILDNTGTRSLGILAAGMMSGMTSPARPWFRLSTSDPQLDESYNVKVWLSECTRLMQMVFNRSNFYRAMHMKYQELGCFGTSATILMDDPKSIVWFYPLNIGEYALAQNYKGSVDTLYREFDLTVDQVVREFGKDKVSDTVLNMYNRGSLEQKVTVTHVIEPRESRKYGSKLAKDMPWKSCYYESGQNDSKYLRESGFKEFRALAPRWKVNSGDTYGSSPAMEALGDIKQLQQQQLRKSQAIDYKTKPPTQAPSTMRNAGGVDYLPGGVTYYDGPALPQGAIKPLFEVNLDLNHLLGDIQDVRERIRGSFFADLFLMIASDDRSGTTAYEIAQRQEEKMLMLGPVVERLHDELLEPVIDMTFTRMAEAGILPPAPPELEGMELNVEFVSVLAQAQRAVATSSVDRYVANLGTIAQFKPEILDKFNADAWADAYADMLGIDPDLIVPGEQVTMIRSQRAQQQAAAAQAEQAVQSSQAAKNMSQAQTSGDNLLAGLMAGTTGYT